MAKNVTKIVAAIVAAVLQLVVALLGLVSCGSEPEFRVRGEVDGLGTQNLRVTLYSGNGVQQQSAQAIDGKFQFQAKTEGPVTGELYTNAGVLMARFIADRGDNLSLKLSATDPAVYEADGNSACEALGEFIAENADIIADGDQRQLNDAVERFVGKHAKSLASGVVISAYFNPAGDEKRLAGMLDRLDRKAKPVWLIGSIEQPMSRSAMADTAKIGSPRLLAAKGNEGALLTPKGSKLLLLAFTDAASRRSDSVANLIGKLAEERKEAALRIADISFDPDTVAWKGSLRSHPSPERVEAYWAVGGAATPGLADLAIGQVPYFVVVDSAGRVLTRTPSVSVAAKKLKIKL